MKFIAEFIECASVAGIVTVVMYFLFSVLHCGDLGIDPHICYSTLDGHLMVFAMAIGGIVMLLHSKTL